MGFETGDHGVKFLICDKFPRATSRSRSVSDGLNAMGINRDGAVLIIDGNCKAMAIPREIRTLDECVEFMVSLVRRAMASVQTVVLCFDDPELVPATKAATQDLRAARVSGPGDPGWEGYPADATFTVATLEGLSDCHPLLQVRAMRYRFFDEVFRRTLTRVSSDMSVMRQMGEETPVLALVGIDVRGASRLASMPRRPATHATDRDVADIIDAKKRTEGEADVHMLSIEARFRESSSLGNFFVNVIVHETVDTDVFGVSLRHHANRVNLVEGKREAIHTYIAMKETSKYAAEKLALYTGDVVGPSGVLFVNVEGLYTEVLEHLAGVMWREALPDTSKRVALVQALVAVWALGGCDFVVRVGYADLLTRALATWVFRLQETGFRGHALAPWLTSSDHKATLRCLREIVAIASVDPTLVHSKTRSRLLSAGDESLLRAAWTSAYWGGEGQYTYGKVAPDASPEAYELEVNPVKVPLVTVGRPYDYSKWGFAGVPDGVLVVETVKRGREGGDGAGDVADEEGEEDEEDEEDELYGGDEVEEEPYDSDTDGFIGMET